MVVCADYHGPRVQAGNGKPNSVAKASAAATLSPNFRSKAAPAHSCAKGLGLAGSDGEQGQRQKPEDRSRQAASCPHGCGRSSRGLPWALDISSWLASDGFCACGGVACRGKASSSAVSRRAS